MPGFPDRWLPSLLARNRGGDQKPWPQLNTVCPRPGFVKKRVVDGNVVLVYAAGLEHTGHNLWHDIFMDAFHHHQAVSESQIGAMDFYYHMLEFNGRCFSESINEDYFLARHLCDDVCKLPHARRQLVERADVPVRRAPQIFYLNSSSYPSQPIAEGESGRFQSEVGKRQNRLRPDLVHLARSAELSGVDLRVMYLTRPAPEILHDHGIEYFHRANKGWRGQAEAQLITRAKVLTGNCQNMLTHLTSLDRAFLACVPYHARLDPEAMGAFLGHAGIYDSWRRVYRESAKKDLYRVGQRSLAAREAVGALAACIEAADNYTGCDAAQEAGFRGALLTRSATGASTHRSPVCTHPLVRCENRTRTSFEEVLKLPPLPKMPPKRFAPGVREVHAHDARR